MSFLVVPPSIHKESRDKQEESENAHRYKSGVSFQLIIHINAAPIQIRIRPLSLTSSVFSAAGQHFTHLSLPSVDARTAIHDPFALEIPYLQRTSSAPTDPAQADGAGTTN